MEEKLVAKQTIYSLLEVAEANAANAANAGAHIGKKKVEPQMEFHLPWNREFFKQLRQ